LLLKLLCSRSRKLIPAHTFVETGLAAWFESAVTLCWTEELFLAYQRARRLNHLPRFLNPRRPLETRQSAHMRVHCTLLSQTKSTSSQRARLYTHKKRGAAWCAQAKGKHFYNVYFFIIYEGVFFSRRERGHLVLCVRLSPHDKKTTAKSLFLCGAFQDLLHNPGGNLCVKRTRGDAKANLLYVLVAKEVYIRQFLPILNLNLASLGSKNNF
jgi:hypothetical protein